MVGLGNYDRGTARHNLSNQWGTVARTALSRTVLTHSCAKQLTPLLPFRGFCQPVNPSLFLRPA